MKEYIVEEVKIGESEGGIACGPVDGNIVVEARIKKDDGDTVYYGHVDVDGFPNFYEAAESRFDKEIAGEISDGSDCTWFDGCDNYNEFYEEVEEVCDEEKTHVMTLKYLVALANLDKEEVEQLKLNSIGKAIGNFDIPVCWRENDYIVDYKDE